jgi:hypothetical protein
MKIFSNQQTLEQKDKNEDNSAQTPKEMALEDKTTRDNPNRNVIGHLLHKHQKNPL